MPKRISATLKLLLPFFVLTLCFQNCSPSFKANDATQNGSSALSSAGVAATVAGHDGFPDAWGQYTFGPAATGYEGYTGKSYASWTAGVEAYGDAMGVNFAYNTTYCPMDSAAALDWGPYGYLHYNGGMMAQPAPYGGTALIPSVGFTMWTQDQKMTFYTIPTGAFDANLKSLVDQFNSAGIKVIHYRPQYEFNLGSITQLGTPNNPALFGSTGAYDPATGTGGTPSPFVLAWQHMVTVMRAEAAANGQKIYFHWNPAENQYNGFDMRMAYPGNDYVDYIGLDIYDGIWPAAGYSGSTLTALPVNWTGFASLAAGSKAQLAGGTFNYNYTAASAVNLETWANDIDNEYHYWDYPGGTQWVPTGQAGTWTTGMMNMIEFAQLMGKGLSFPEVGVGVEYASVGKLGGLSGGNPGQNWAGGGLSPWNQNGSNFPGYLKSRIAYAQSLGIDVVFVANFVANYGYNGVTNEWLGGVPAIGDSFKKAFGATYPTPAH